MTTFRIEKCRYYTNDGTSTDTFYYQLYRIDPILFGLMSTETKIFFKVSKDDDEAIAALEEFAKNEVEANFGIIKEFTL